MKQLSQDADLTKDPFRKKYGEELPSLLVKDKVILAMFLHWAYRLGRGALDNWKKHTKKEDNFTEGFAGLDLTDKEIFDWLEDNYGEDIDLKRLRNKLDAARQLLYEVFTEDHSPQEWNELVETKRVLKARNVVRKTARQNIKNIVIEMMESGIPSFDSADVRQNYLKRYGSLEKVYHGTSAYQFSVNPKFVSSALGGIMRVQGPIHGYVATHSGGKRTYTLKKSIEKSRGSQRKEFRLELISIIDEIMSTNPDSVTMDEFFNVVYGKYPKGKYRNFPFDTRKISEIVGKIMVAKYPNYSRSRYEGSAGRTTKYTLIKSDFNKAEEPPQEGTKNNFILPNKPMYRIFEIDDMKELKGFTGDWVVQEKYDGMRIQIHKTDTIKVYSFNNNDITGKFDKQIKILKKDEFENCILDAEAVLYDGDDPLHRADTLAYVNSKKQSKDYQIKVHVFDIMRLEGEDIGVKKLEERLKILMQKFSPHSDEYLQFPNKKDTRFADSLEEIEDYAKEIMKNPTSEGVIIKDAKSSYIVGKKKNPKWIKWKKFVDLDLIVLDVRKNKNGTYSYTLGASANDTDYKPLVEIDDEKYLSVGKALNTKIKSEKGKIIRVKVDEVKKTKTGFSIYSAKVIEIPEVTEPEKVITLEFLSKDNKKSISDYNIEALKKSYEITDNIHGNATLNTTLDTDGFVLTGFYQNNLMSKNAMVDIDIWKEKLKEAYIKDGGVFLTYITNTLEEDGDLSPQELHKKLKEGIPDLYDRVFSDNTKDIEKSLINYLKEKGEAYGIGYNEESKKFYRYEKTIIKMDNSKYEVWKREDGDLNFIYKTKDREFAWRIEQDEPDDIYELFGKATKYLAQVDKKADKTKLIDKGDLELGSQRDGYHEYLLDGKMYQGKFHVRVVPIKKQKKWVAWTGYETEPTDASSDEDMWNIEADKYRNIKYIE
jgi:ATP-dependent DNA ligase